MSGGKYQIEDMTPFSQSLIWEINRAYYNGVGIEAWREGEVPHHLTSNSVVGKTYAELIFAFLKDLARKGKSQETVYLLELGSGHGRLCFHILKHLDNLVQQSAVILPSFCYILSDLVEQNLAFFRAHPQFQVYFERGNLDVAYFDAVNSEEIVLQQSGRTITQDSLAQPLLVIANYFFDSIPQDLFRVRQEKMYECSVALECAEDPAEMDAATLLEKVELAYGARPLDGAFYDEDYLNRILDGYANQFTSTYLLFPHQGLRRLERLRRLSRSGLLLLTMDKGEHELKQLKNKKTPAWITHGSFSLSVNYHAFAQYCEQADGLALFPDYSNFHLELGCLLMVEDPQDYLETQEAYRRFVNDYGPDDFFALARFSYKHVKEMNVRELLGLLRMGAYDSTLFENVLPRLKEVSQKITHEERTRINQMLHRTWEMYFTLNESYDLAFEMGGILYDLGYYHDAILFFDYSAAIYGRTEDAYYNKALCYYQLEEDDRLMATVNESLAIFPEFKKIEELSELIQN
jgi:tetratricopeptide (TPR) repeat protein